MKKQHAIPIVILLGLLLALIMPVQAQDAPNAFDVAEYLPIDTAALISIRADDAYLNQLDGLLARIDIPDVPVITTRDILNFGLDITLAPFTIDEMLSWLGDQVFIGFSTPTGTPTNMDDFIIYGFVDDVDAGFDFFRRTVVGDFVDEYDLNDFTVLEWDSFSVAERDGLMLIGSPESVETYINNYDAIRDGLSLAGNAQFAALVAELPESHYNIGVYGLPDDTLPQPIAMGATILSDDTLTIDIAGMLPDDLPFDATDAPTLDPLFAQYLPADTSGVVMGSDLGYIYDSLVQAFAAGGLPEAGPEIERLLGLFGFDLQDDILSWMTGDYAVFFRSDITTFINDFIDESLNMDVFDGGLVIATNDPERTSAFVNQLSVALPQVGFDDNVVFGEDMIGDVPVKTLTASLPAPTPSGFITLEFVYGHTDAVFFFAVRDAAEAIVTGGDTLNAQPAYQAALGHALPDMTTFWYTDGEGLVATFAGFVLLVPMSDPMGGPIYDEFDARPGNGAATMQTVQFDNPDIELLFYAVDLIESSTVSANFSETGTSRVRLTLTVGR